MQVNARPEDIKGQYSNVVLVTSQEREVVLDFLMATVAGDSGQQAQLQSRLILNHFTARELADAIQKNLAQWEEKRYGSPKK